MRRGGCGDCTQPRPPWWPYAGLVLSVFLFEDTLFNTYCWLSNAELMTQLYSPYLKEAYLTHIFFLGNIIAFLHLGTLDSPSARYMILGGPFQTGKWPKKKPTKHKHAKNVAPNRLRKGRLFIVGVESSRVRPCLTSAGNTCGGWVTRIFHHPVHNWEWPQKCRQTDWGVTNKF